MPVVPEVYMITATSSALGGATASGAASPLAWSSSKRVERRVERRGGDRVGLLHGVLDVDDARARLHARLVGLDGVGHDLEQLGVGHDDLRLGLRRAVDQALLAERRVDGDHLQRLRECGLCGEHPLPLRLGVDDHAVLGLRTQGKGDG
eukprot:scaffold39947_cov58-Phaeocystis_antarctica.AAC.1